jgi:hypothetical protein
MKLTRILAATAAAACLVVFSSSDAIASGSEPRCPGTPPADWSLKDQGTDKDLLGGETASSGTATISNDGPGSVTVNFSGGLEPVTVRAGQTKHLQVPKGKTVEIQDSVDAGNAGSKGTVTWTPNCDGAVPPATPRAPGVFGTPVSTPTRHG